jgi:hypothetical protein
MSDLVVVGCPYCKWIGLRDRSALRRERMIACESCRALFSSSEAEASGVKLEARRRVLASSHAVKEARSSDAA